MGADIRFRSFQLDIKCLRDRGRDLYSLRGMRIVSDVTPVYTPTFADTHCAYSEKNGQAKWTWAAGTYEVITSSLADGYPSQY